MYTKNVITSDSYKRAQEYESEYWKSRQHDPVGLISDLEGSIALSQHLQQDGYLQHVFDRILDVGCGAMGIGTLWLIQAREQHAVEPLPILPPATGNKAFDQFIREVQSDVRYIRCGAEKLPYEDAYFDCVVCNNVLDHANNPYDILSEIRRVLRPGGLFAFAVDTHSLRTLVAKKIMKVINPEYGSLPGHPYEWTETQMTKILKKNGFDILGRVVS